MLAYQEGTAQTYPCGREVEAGMMFLPLPRQFLSLGVGPATRCPKGSLALTPGAGRFHSVWLALMGSRAAAGCAPIWG